MSIYNKIRIIFLVAVLFTTAFFSSFVYIQKNDHIQRIEKRYMQTSLYIHRYFKQNIEKNPKAYFQDSNLKLFLDESDFTFVKNRKHIKQVLKNSHLIYMRKLPNSHLEVRGIKGQFYLYIKNPRYKIMFKDKQLAKFPWHILVWYLLALVFLTALYFWLTRSLKPLKTLQEQIQKVVEGNLSVSVKSNQNDEIAQVANAFDDALRKLESLINSRQLFLRSIMHELKTPIAKGKLLNEFLEDNNSQKDSYEAVFERLELLIEEFSKIERMLSSSYKTKLASYNARDIIEQALELMIMDEEEIEERVTIIADAPCSVYTDFELLSLAIKNLIDNAIKYSPDSSVKIIIKKDGIYISNIGEQFTNSLKPYLEPFHGQKNGLGLGLYIVQNILKMLSLEIEYSYTKGENLFWIKVS